MNFWASKVAKFMSSEKFSLIGSNIQSSDDKKTLSTRINGESAYGSVIVDASKPNGVLTWKIKINKIGQYTTIGVVSDKVTITNTGFTITEQSYYAYKVRQNWCWVFDHNNHSGTAHDDLSTNWKDKDVMTMILDTNERTITYYQNNQMVYEFNNIERQKYKFAVLLHGVAAESSITLQNFEIKSDQKDVGDIKEKEANTSQQNNTEIVEELLSKIQAQNKEIQQLKGDNSKQLQQISGLESKLKQKSEVCCRYDCLCQDENE